MSMNLRNLDARTRELMMNELNYDLEHNTLYLSPRLTQAGRGDYVDILRSAIRNGTTESFAAELRKRGSLKTHEERQKPKGGTTRAKVPATAADTLAEGEFNRFYVRGLCRRALEDGINEVIVYRAKVVRDPRPDSEAMIGRRVSANILLQDLRTHPGVEPALGLPPGPNSGLSVMLP